MKRTALAFLWIMATVFLAAQETHTVQTNQTLYSIARLYNVTVDQLRSWNNLGDQTIRVGQSLVVRPTSTRNANPALIPFVYTVRTGDTLSGLSIKYGTPVTTLRQINSLDRDQGLYVGQRLYIRRPVGVTFYTAQPGDTVQNLSVLFNIPANDLRKINQLSSDVVTTGKVLRVFKPAEVPLNHTVAATDTPAGVAALYDMSVDDLKKLNGAAALQLKVGQVLKLRTYASASQNVLAAPTQDNAVKNPTVAFPATSASQDYIVQKGDSLMKITRTFGVRLADLLAWNGLQVDDVLHVGQSIKVQPPAGTGIALTEVLGKTPVTTVAFPSEAPATVAVSTPAAPAIRDATNLPDFRDEDQAKIRWDSYVVLDKSIPVFEWNNDYYYWTHPGEQSQPNRGYYENNWPSPLDAYKKGTQLLAKFDNLIDRQPKLSHLLAGRTIVLDPGHGGLDPGAIVKATDEQGNDVFLTEHEYVYDIALRVYALLKRHGANVELTIVAPSHLIRDTKPSDNTLVNEKNQVYNDRTINAADDDDAWPNGSAKGLERRVTIANKDFAGVAPGNRVFVSLHADNNPFSPYGTGVYALETSEGQDAASLNFAQKLVPYLGSDAYARTQNLAVLRGNKADYKILIEVHNLASDDQSQAMRAGSSRQLSAQKIVRGILEALGK